MNKTRVVTTADDFASTLSYIELVALATVLGFISLVTVVGNALVMLSFILDKKLRTHTNYFLLSLAVSDMLIGVISMPLFSQYLLRGEWTLGEVVCDIWLAQDYMCSNASSLNLLVIGFDRYLSVTRPLKYRAKRTGRRVALMISCVWIVSFLMWPPWIYAWPYIDGRRTVPEDDCYVQFLETNFYLTIITSILDCYLPLLIMLILYYKIWRETQKRERYLANMEAGHLWESLNSKKKSAGKHQKNGKNIFDRCSKLDRGNQKSPPGTRGGSLPWSTSVGAEVQPEGHDSALVPLRHNVDSELDLPDTVSDTSQRGKNASGTLGGTALGETASLHPHSSDLNTLSEFTIASSRETMHSKSSSGKHVGVKNDHKAARVLTAILLAFIVTTTPYNVIVVIKNLDSTHSIVPDAVWLFFYYLFYVNSTLNPVCYALANKSFKRTYWKILTCSWSGKHQTVYSFSHNCSDKSLPSSQNMKCTTSL